jgi:hypothetical protein
MAVKLRLLRFVPQEPQNLASLLAACHSFYKICSYETLLYLAAGICTEADIIAYLAQVAQALQKMLSRDLSYFS